MKNILDEFYDNDLFHPTEIEHVDRTNSAELDRLVNSETVRRATYYDSTDFLNEYQSADSDLHNLSTRIEFRKCLAGNW